MGGGQRGTSRVVLSLVCMCWTCSSYSLTAPAFEVEIPACSERV